MSRPMCDGLSMSEGPVVTAGTGVLENFQRAFTSYVRDPQQAPPPPEISLERMQLYAQLVFGNVERVMSNMFPVLKSLLSAARWNELARGFFRDHDMHDPLFQSMPREFVSYVEGLTPVADDPPFLLELAHYEWVDYALSIDTTEVDLTNVDRAGCLLAGTPLLNPLVWMLSYQFPVHRFRDEAPLADAPAAPTYLVAYRDLEDCSGYFELNTVSARLLELLDESDGQCGAELLRRVATEIGADYNEAFIAAGRDMLEGLRARDIVLGVKLGFP